MTCTTHSQPVSSLEEDPEPGLMAVYQAAFQAGPARSKRTREPFSHAWRVTFRIGEELAFTGGFCSTRQLAEDAAARHAKLIGPARRRSSAQLHQVEIAEAQLASASIATPVVHAKASPDGK